MSNTSKKGGVRHGEIMLIPVELTPAGRRFSHTQHIVGHSETGHHHVLEAEKPFDLIVTTNDQWFYELFSTANLVHKKQTDRHRTITIDPGIYKRFHDTEYNPFEKIIENVRD